MTNVAPAPRKRRAPVFASRLSFLRYRVHALAAELGLSETELRDTLEGYTGYRYCRLCSEADLEFVVERLEARKPTAPELDDEELEAYCRDLLEVA